MKNFKEMVETDKKKTAIELQKEIDKCREVFYKKMEDYGTSWSIMRPISLTDQIYIKAKRIRTLEELGVEKAAVNEGIEPEFIGIINYSAMGLIQLSRKELTPLNQEDAMGLYDRSIAESVALMMNKNHDYDEAWRNMRVSSFTDIILQKLLRTKEIEDNNGVTKVSEGIDANYMDIINYAFFALIKLTEEKQ